MGETYRVGASSRPVDSGYAEWMRAALELARAAGRHSDVPVGALVIDRLGEVVGEGQNRREVDGDILAHAEVVALRAAALAMGSWRLDGCTLVVTLEPCPMCCWAMQQARVDRVVFGAWDDKAGACGSVWDLARDRQALHRVEVVGGVLADECAAVLSTFFESRR